MKFEETEVKTRGTHIGSKSFTFLPERKLLPVQANIYNCYRTYKIHGYMEGLVF